MGLKKTIDTKRKGSLGDSPHSFSKGRKEIQESELESADPPTRLVAVQGLQEEAKPQDRKRTTGYREV